MNLYSYRRYFRTSTMKHSPTKQIAGIYHRRVGEYLVTALSDGYVEMGYHIFREFEPHEVDEMLARDHRISPPRISVNCFFTQIRVRQKDCIMYLYAFGIQGGQHFIIIREVFCLLNIPWFHCEIICSQSNILGWRCYRFSVCKREYVVRGIH